MGWNSANYSRYVRGARQPFRATHSACHWQAGAESISGCDGSTANHAEQACVTGGSVAVRAGQSERGVSADRRAVGIHRRKTDSQNNNEVTVTLLLLSSIQSCMWISPTRERLPAPVLASAGSSESCAIPAAPPTDRR